MFLSVYFMLCCSFAFACDIKIYGNANGNHGSCKADLDKLEKLIDSNFRKTDKSIQENNALLLNKLALLNDLMEKIQQGDLTKLEKMMISKSQKTEEAFQKSNTLLRQMSKKLKEFLKDTPQEQLFDDVAHDKIAGQSSTQESRSIFTADKALDGNLTTFSHTKLPGEIKAYWWVNLGHEYKVARIEVFNRGDCCGERFHDVDVTIGPTLKDMKLCTNYKGPAKNKEHIVLDCGVPITGRFVKLTITHGKGILQIAELKVLAYRQQNRNSI